MLHFVYLAVSDFEAIDTPVIGETGLADEEMSWRKEMVSECATIARSFSPRLNVQGVISTGIAWEVLLILVCDVATNGAVSFFVCFDEMLSSLA